MANILLTGGSGFLGSALTDRLLAKGSHVYSLSRHPPELKEGLTPIEGDILSPNLGISSDMPRIDCLYHLAAIHRLGYDKDGLTWHTNVGGTANVISFSKKHEIPHLYFVSSAYTHGRNVYEQSKSVGEAMVRESGIPTTIFKPSIVMGTPQHFFSGHFAQFVKLLVSLHRRAEVVRRRVEGTLRLPVIEPVFRMVANPKAKLNLVTVDDVVRGMADIKAPGTYWLTNPSPPTIEQLVEWVGNFIMVRIKVEAEFNPMPIEAIFQSRSAAFTPYLWDDNFPSDLKDCQPITEKFVQDIIRLTVLT